MSTAPHSILFRVIKVINPDTNYKSSVLLLKYFIFDEVTGTNSKYFNMLKAPGIQHPAFSLSPLIASYHGICVNTHPYVELGPGRLGLEYLLTYIL